MPWVTATVGDVDRPELIDPDVVRTWLRAATAALGASREDLDRVNVFPVADGDTGTNMYLTVREASAAVHDADDDASGRRLLRLAARAALLGARGNSGVILSEWLRGLAVAASRGEGLGPGLDVAARSARQAVARPAPGTILTAAESAAAAARHAEAGGMVGPLGAPAHLPVLDAARRGAREAALRSVGALAPLRDAGVLDAGACGLVLVLDALAAAQRHVDLRAGAVSEADASMGPVLLDMDLRGHRPPPDADPAAPAPAGTEHAAADEVELMFVLHRPHHASGFRDGAVADALRADLDEVGDSVVVVGGSDGGEGHDDSLWQAHVHTPDLEAALEVPRRWARRGEVSRVYVRHLAVAAEDWAVVVTTSAPHLAAELASGGAVVLLDLDTAPTVDDVAQTVLGAGTPHVLVLAPSDVLDDGRLADATAAIRARDVARDDRAAIAPAPGVTVVAADDDVHLVTAVAALADALDAAGPAGPPDVPHVVRAALGRLRTARTAAAEAVGVLGGLVADVPAPGIVALLPDTGLPASVLDDLAEAAAALAPDADVVVLPTGRPGTGVGIGVEPASDDAAPQPVGGPVDEEAR
ncbi:DAK2 domain protein [Isoptericola dokdonensis DS-3]|uniref:DAK2 domain protein n=1 Tax=Isoptericola dokdonensis DS-3 TaxID=1300344 RepID=A0A168E8J4_9MICO|nr:DAK2 domain protein [Isoptericola dokdonensis DS-3]